MNYTHILFLDFDGPLFSGKALLMPENNDTESEILKELKLHPLISYWKADPMAIAILHNIYKLRHYQLVISSSWADMHTKEQIERILKINNINILLHKNWKIIRKQGTNNKAIEIKEWLDNNKCGDYLILDDLDSAENLNNLSFIKKIGLDNSKIIIVDYDEGITMRNYYEMQAIVSNWK